MEGELTLPKKSYLQKAQIQFIIPKATQVYPRN